MELTVEAANRIFYQSGELEFSTSVARAEYYATHVHQAQFQLEFVLHGETECGIGSQRFVLPEQHYSLVNPDVEHHNVTRGWKHALFLIFDRRVLDETAWQLFRFMVQPVTFLDVIAPCPAGISTILQTLVYEFRQPEAAGRRLLLDTALIQLSVLLLRTLRGTHSSRAAAVQESTNLSAQIARAVELIYSSFHHDLSLDDLAQAAGMSRYHFLRCFKAQLGETPYAYMMRTRLRAAAKLLRSTSRAITDIALTCGFASLSHFGTVFRKVYHCSPSMYRHPQERENAIIQDEAAR